MNTPDSEDKATEERRLSLALETLREAYSEEQASPATEEQLLAEFRLASRGTRPDPRRSWARWAVAAVAALLLACGLVFWLVIERVSEPQPIAEAKPNPIKAGRVTAERGTDRIASAPAEVPVATEPRDVKQARNTVAARSTQHTARSKESEPGPFIATMIPTGSEADYGLQLVRVELPRRTMMSFGLPVDPRQLNRPVKADLIIGPDGLTRAIRFVQ